MHLSVHVHHEKTKGEPTNMPFLCPKCNQPLYKDGMSFRCADGHCYDCARSGYVNLLPPGKGTHGDDARMVRARRAFLSEGYYRPLMKSIADFCSKELPVGGTVLDCGCGEGSYTAEVLSAVSDRDVRMIGVDISKAAVDAAAKHVRGAQFAVASVFHLPIASESADGILNLFAPMVPGEYARVLKEGGWVLKAAPLPLHLYELKQAVYETAYLTEPEPEEWEGFSCSERWEICFPMRPEGTAAIRALFEMTPYCYTTPKAGFERLAKITSLEVTAAFRLSVYRKQGGKR